MDFRKIDLNLLVVLDALFSERTVTAAARRLRVSQPTVSFSLNKLRDALGDELFIRTSGEMRPTPRAMVLREPVRRILETVANDVILAEAFKPLGTRRTITVCLSDIGEMTFLPLLLQRLRALAPQADVESVSLRPAALTAALEEGRVDLALGYFPDLKGNVRRQKLFEHGFACLVRRGHPVIKDALTLEAFLSLDHLVVSAEGRSQEIFEKEMAERGYSRRVALRSPHFMSAPLIIESSDMIATIPRAVGLAWSRRSELRLLDPPFPIPAISLGQYWHRRFDDDPRNLWLRQLVAEMFVDKDPSSGA